MGIFATKIGSIRIIMKYMSKGQSFYFLDVQEREYDHYGGETESVRPCLLVFPDPGCEDFESQFAKLLIANLVMNNGTWFMRKTRQSYQPN